MACTKNKLKKNKYCIGALKQKATFSDRAASGTTGNDLGFTENFFNDVVVWVGVETTAGKDLFDGVNAIGTATHKIIARYSTNLQDKKWIVLRDRRLKVLRTTNVAEEDEWLEFLCSETGQADKIPSRL